MAEVDTPALESNSGIQAPKKKWLRRVLMWLFFLPIILVISLFLLLQVHAVQTWLAHQASDYFSKEWNTTVRINELRVDLWGEVHFTDLLILDQKQDTLVSVPTFTITDYDYHFSTGDFQIEGIQLKDGTAKLLKYKNEEHWNYHFLTEYFTSDTPSSSEPSDGSFKIQSVVMENMHLIYKNENAIAGDAREWNFEQFELNHLSVQVSDFIMEKSDVFATIEQANFKESKSNFEVKQLHGCVHISDLSYAVTDLIFASGNSQIVGDLSLSVQDTSQWKYADSLMQIQVNVSELKLKPSDFTAFTHQVDGLNQQFYMRGQVTGTLRDLRLNGIQIETGKDTYVSGDLELKNLAGNEAFVYSFQTENMQLTYADLIQIPNYPFSENNALPLPVNLAYLGTLEFKGNVAGSAESAELEGNFNSDIGSLYTQLKVSGLQDHLNYSGKLELKQFNLAEYYQNQDLGIVTANLEIEGSGTRLQDLELNFKGDIQECGLMGYTYRNISTDGTFKKQFYNGQLQVQDANVQLDFDGQIDFSTPAPILDFDLNLQQLNLSKIGLVEDPGDVVLEGEFHASLQSLDINEMQGELTGSNVSYTKNEQVNTIEYFTLDAEQGDQRHLTLNSEIGKIELLGEFKFNELGYAVQDILSEILPGFEPSKREHAQQNFNLTARIKDFDFIQAAFIPELSLATGTSLNFEVNESNRVLSGTFGTDYISYENIEVRNAVADISRADGSIYFVLGAEQVLNESEVVVNEVSLDTRSLGDTIFTALTWGGSTDWLKGDINGVFFLRSLTDLRFEFDQSSIQLNGGNWYFNDQGEIDICENELAVSQFGLRQGNQLIAINGVVSDSPYEQLSVELNNMNLDQLNPYLGESMKLFGELDGNVALRNLYDSPIASADLTLSDLKLNEYELGSVCLKSAWDPGKKKVRVDGELDQAGLTPLRFAGAYLPFEEKNSLDFLVTLNAFDLNVLNAFLGPDVLTLEGSASTMLSVQGEPESPKLNGELFLQNTKIGVPFLQTTYTLSDKIKITEDMFAFANVKLIDEENHAGTATGQVFHEEFSNWSYDVFIEMEKPMLVMNTTEDDNSDFYGRAYATGYAEISGHDDKTEFEIVMKSEKGTTFNLPMSSSGDQQFDSFIRFVNPLDTVKKAEPKADLSGLSLNMQLDVTEDAEFQVIFDEAVGDVMKGRGKGHLSLTVNQLSSLGMYGFLEVTEGTYLFTLKNLVNKPFAVKPGGYIAWYGDPLKGELDLKAVYKASANLNDLLGDPTQNNGKRAPVNLLMNLQGKMMNPTIGFDIELPQSDELVKSRVASVISTEQERNRQAFALLVMGRFVSPPNITQTAQQNGGGVGLANNGSELLSSQISNWLSQISDDFDLGFNYRPGDKISNEEIELALSTQLFNDRITVSGNFGVARGNSENQSTNYIGDIRIEYNITRDGRVKLMVYNESNNQRLTAVTQSPYTQGVGVVYQEEFDNWGEFVSGLKTLFDKQNLKLNP